MIAFKPPLNAQIELPMPAISALCRKYGVEQLAVFGSVLRDDFHADSDVDFLVVFQNNDYGPWMGKLTELEEELGFMEDGCSLIRRDIAIRIAASGARILSRVEPWTNARAASVRGLLQCC